MRTGAGVVVQKIRADDKRDDVNLTPRNAAKQEVFKELKKGQEWDLDTSLGSFMISEN